MFRRKREGSVICTSCGVLVGVNDDKCYNCGRRNPGLWGFAPALRALGHDLGFVPFVIGTCVIVYGLTLVASAGQIGMNGTSFLSPSLQATFLFGASGAVPVFRFGRWWTVLSAAWLHGSALHIFFNMWVLRQMGPATADLYGPGRTVIIYTVGAVAGFVLSSVAGAYFPPLVFLRGSSFTVGASAPIAGLIGAIFYYGRNVGSTAARAYAMNYIIAMVLYALFLPGIDNYAHAGGFAGGYLVAGWLNPMREERIDHIAIAVVCLALSIGSIVLSVVTGLQYI